MYAITSGNLDPVNHNSDDLEFIMETSGGRQCTVVVNITASEWVQGPFMKKNVVPDGRTILQWQVPYSVSLPTFYNSQCIFDMFISSNTHHIANRSDRFMHLLRSQAHKVISCQLDTIDTCDIDIGGYKVPLVNCLAGELSDQVQFGQLQALYVNFVLMDCDIVCKEHVTPHYSMNEISKFEVRHEDNAYTERSTGESSAHQQSRLLITKIDLPLITSKSQLALIVTKTSISLDSDNPLKYHLNVELPFAYETSLVYATFHKSSHTLIIMLPIENLHYLHSSQIAAWESTVSYIEHVNVNDLVANNISAQSEMESLHNQVISCPRNMHNESKIHNVVPRTFPRYKCHQDMISVTFIFEVDNVDTDSFLMEFLEGHNGFWMKLDAGIHEIQRYSFSIRFHDHCKLDIKKCQVVCDEVCIIVILSKASAAGEHWLLNKFKVGLSEENLQEMFMMSELHMIQQIEKLKAFDVIQPEYQKDYHAIIDVKEMDKDKLLVNVKYQFRNKRKKQLSESADEIQVVHEKHAPVLKGIIKQRSRTTSESSDDIYMASSIHVGRTNSFNGSDSPFSESDENIDNQMGHLRKNVSFSDHVDKTTFKTTQSVCSMKSTLKNRRKKQRKADRRQAGMTNNPKQRKNSGSASSDDGSSNESEHFNMGGAYPAFLEESKDRSDSCETCLDPLI